MTNVVKLQTSRRFLITQAVLNAADKHFTFCIKRFGIGAVLQKILDGDDTVRAGFYLEVCEEFDELNRTYEEAPDDCAFTDPDFAAAVNGFAEFHA